MSSSWRAAAARLRPLRRWRVILPALAVTAVLLGGYGWWVGWAGDDELPPSADAVVVHAGQRHRLRLALRLMDEEVAPVLVLFYGETGYPGDGPELCLNRRTPYEVLCPEPNSQDTAGEARALAALAEEREWNSVVVVTSDYHLRRARYLDRKCTDIDIAGVSARPRTLTLQVQRTIGEMIALPLAWFSRC